MNDLGLILAWSSLQVSLLMVPAAALHALASRRGAVSGAWMAALGLALSVAITVAAFIPWRRGTVESPARLSTFASTFGGNDANRNAIESVADGLSGSVATRTVDHGAGLPLSFAALRGFLSRLERGTATPLDRFRPWGSLVAASGLAGAGIGLFRLLLGLWGVRLCRRRGTITDDPNLIRLLEEIRVGIGCHQEVEVRQVPDLVTPATAGWRHPVVFLPDDWQSWDDAAIRAVLAHELAHIHRRDYATGFVARLAVAIHFYHPLVWWLAGRLQLQQELAADEVGARFAGGRGPYLLALSRLALRQDGQSPCWPARAFLPARGTLIRRIAMLRDVPESVERPWSRPRRLLAACCLLGVAAGVLALRGPACGADDKPPGVASSRPAVVGSAPKDTSVRVVNTAEAKPVPRIPGPSSPIPIELVYVPENMVGLLAFRPAATFRRGGMAQFATRIREATILAMHDGLKSMKQIEASRPERMMLRLEDIEWVTCGINFGRTHLKNADEAIMHTLSFGGSTVRAVRPFDWLAFLRAWGLEFTEVREPGGMYQRITGRLKPVFGPNPCVYLPDDRTIVLEEEAPIQKLIRKVKPGLPAYLTGPEWDLASRGLLAIAFNNQDGAFAKAYDLGRPDDAEVLSLFKGVDRWVFGVDDADAISLHAMAVCGTNASETIAGKVESLVKLGRAALEHPGPEVASELNGHALPMVKGLLANLRVGHDNGSVQLHTAGFGTLAELGAIIEADLKAEVAAGQKWKARTK